MVNWIGAVLVLVGAALLVVPAAFPAAFLGSISQQGDFFYRDFGNTIGMRFNVEVVNAVATPDVPLEFSSASWYNEGPMQLSVDVGGKRVATGQSGTFCETDICRNTGRFTSFDEGKAEIVVSSAALSAAGVSNGTNEVAVYWDHPKHGHLLITTFEMWLDDSSCELSDNVMVVAETFTAGRTFSKMDLRFPVKAFCANLPALITAQGKVIEQNLAHYGLLQNGSSITAEVGTTETIFYIANLDPSVTVVCQNGVFDSETNECIVSPPIVFSCSGDAVFDPVEQLCISQAETRIVCGLLDAVYNTETGQCVKIIPQDAVEVVCPANSTAFVNQEGLVEKCVFEAVGATEWVCQSGHLDTSTVPPKCVKEPETALTPIQLATGSGSDSGVILIAAALIIVGVVLFVRG